MSLVLSIFEDINIVVLRKESLMKLDKDGSNSKRNY